MLGPQGSSPFMVAMPLRLLLSKVRLIRGRVCSVPGDEASVVEVHFHAGVGLALVPHVQVHVVPLAARDQPLKVVRKAREVVMKADDAAVFTLV